MENNKFSIISLISGLLALNPFLLFTKITPLIIVIFYAVPYTILLSTTGVITGIIGLSQIKKTKQEGKLFAILGIIFSVIGTLGFLLILVSLGGAIGSFI